MRIKLNVKAVTGRLRTGSMRQEGLKINEEMTF